MNRLTLTTVLLILALPLMLVGCKQPAPTNGEKPAVQPPPDQPPANASTEGVGERVPDFTVTDIDGKSHSPKDYNGRILIIDFWATYCKPCVKKLGEYAIDPIFKHRDVGVVALSMDDSDEVIRGWRKQQGDEFAIPLARLDETTRKAFFGVVPIVPIPQVRVVDRKGIVRYAFGADSTAEQLSEAVKTLLEEK